MRITIDNLDGAGALDYTDAVVPKAKGGSTLRIERGLNVPSRCTAEVQVGACGLPLPARKGRVGVCSEDGAVLFTGYLATEPVRVYDGATNAGIAYRAKLTAVSDEWLLDKLGPSAGRAGSLSLGLDARALLARLMTGVDGGAGLLSVASGSAVNEVAAFATRISAPWSESAGEAANAAFAGYRAVDGQVTLATAGSVTHALSDVDGTLEIANLQLANVRELTNDVTVSGEDEPAAYVSEIFTGDGTTTVFELSEPAFEGTQRVIVDDRFEGASFDATEWSVRDPGSHLSVTSAGLTMSGGNGFDGQTTLTALDAVEMGGSVVVELSGVTLGAASEGVLGGMYSGAVALVNCFAGFRVKQSGGVTVIVPVVNGVETGSTFTPVSGHRYTLRLRLHCVEMQRVRQRYACMVDGVVQSFGDTAGIDAPMDAVMELVDEGAASNTPATVLYDSVAASATLASTPATCEFAAVNAVQMFGSVAAVNVSRPGSMWVESTFADGSQATRLMGVAGEGVDCSVQYGSRGKITFFAGRIPVAGERVTVMYRTRGRAVARLADAGSVAAEVAAGVPGTSRWLGKVLQPPARSSVDCESAAQAVLAFGISRSAATAGTYKEVNPTGDVWPGDVLVVTSEDVTTSLLVRKVAIDDGGVQPEVKRYVISFANDWATDWADGLGLRLSESIAADALLPAEAASVAGAVLDDLQAMRVTSLSGTALGLDAGVDPPVGGGFEVRRRDWVFGASNDADLVLRSAVRSFSISRAAQVERFYVRMYDASTPRKYSRWSSAVVVNAPVG